MLYNFSNWQCHWIKHVSLFSQTTTVLPTTQKCHMIMECYCCLTCFSYKTLPWFLTLQTTVMMLNYIPKRMLWWILPVVTNVLDGRISESTPLQWYQLSQNSNMNHTQTDLNRDSIYAYSAAKVEVIIKTFWRCPAAVIM
jgi:hypothetical protein